MARGGVTGRRAALAVAGLLALWPGLPHPAAAGEGVGLGVIVGEPTGLSLKVWLGGGRAVDAAAAWSFSENDSLQLHADYLVHDYAVFRPGELRGRLPVFYGMGARFKLRESGGRARNDEDAILGVRFPLGLAYEFAGPPLELFGEIVPVLDLAPDTDFAVNAAVGVRYYFR